MQQVDIKRSPEDWLELIKESQQTNMSAKAWCHKQNIPYKKFIYWRRRLTNSFGSASQAPSSLFVELSDKPQALSGVEIHYHNFSLKLQKGFDPLTLLSCLEVMQRLQC